MATNDYQYNAGQYASYQPPSDQPQMSPNPDAQYGYGAYPQNTQPQTGGEQPYFAGEVPQDGYKNEEFDIDYTSFIIRKGFIKKVYGILFSQLAISLIFISLTFIPAVKKIILFDISNNPLIVVFLFVFVVVTIVVFSVFVCCPQVARTVPYNYLLLFSFTLCMSFYLSLLCARYDTEIVFSALALTCAATIGLTLYAATTKTDYTSCGGFLFAFCLIMIFSFGLFFWVGYYVFYCALGVLLYSLYLVYDTQLILGKFGSEYKIDDYCFAALNLYIDIIYLFIKILEILGSKR
jgi:FtsH-binding integral membrane protein